MNSHAECWVRMLDAGSETDSKTRIKNNMTSTDSLLAPLYTLRKDNKKFDDEYKGPPVSPVCGAIASYNHRLSHLISVILTEVWKSKESSSVCVSTEAMIAEMNRTNDTQQSDNLIIGSIDVVALYPSLNIDFTIDKVCEVSYDSNVKIKGMNYEEMGLYLALTKKTGRVETTWFS